VRFEVVVGGGSVAGSPAVSDADGVAILERWTLGTGAGRNELRATVAGATAVSFEAIATPGGAKAVVAMQGGGQTAAAGSTVPINPAVAVRDTFANPVPGVTVVFSVEQGGGGVTGARATSDSAGVAAVGGWTLGPASGEHHLIARVPGLPSITFSAIAAAGAAANAAAAAGDGQTASVGTLVSVPPAVRVADQNGNPVAEIEVTFSVAAGGGSVTGATTSTDGAGIATVGGWELGTTPGPNTLTATAAGLTESAVSFDATATAGPAASVTPAAGEGQSAAAGTQVSIDPAVRVTDAFGNPVSGASVVFAVTSGGGSVTGANRNTTSSGFATVGSWTLGATPGANSLTATVAGGSIAGNPVIFNATGTGDGPASGYDIVVRFNAGSVPTAAQQGAFDAAEDRWEEVVIGDLPDVPVDRPTGTCSSTSPINETVDDLLILVTLEAIDGPGGVLGSAGPCLIRSGSDLPLAGSMRFDTADLTGLESSGLLEEVVLHEMGHVLGVGSLWRRFGFLADPSQSGGVDPHFTGAQAIAAFNALGGSGYTGAKVPVEDTGGSGTADAHWRETIFDKEVMTGWIDAGTNPLSAVTVSSLSDHGYTTDPDSSEPLSLSFSLSIVPRSRASPSAVLLVDDVAHGPIEVVDSRGRTERILQE
jgi:hypothetical protein